MKRSPDSWEIGTYICIYILVHTYIYRFSLWLTSVWTPPPPPSHTKLLCNLCTEVGEKEKVTISNDSIRKSGETKRERVYRTGEL